MQKRIVRALLVANTGSVALFVVRALSYQSSEFWYLNWNLLLAWLPVCFAWLLIGTLTTRSWRSWQAVALSLLWLGFLPNSFYLVTDFVHLQHSTTVLFDIVMLLSFTLNGLILGYLSVVMVHEQLRKRFTSPTPEVIIAVVFLLCSFAIYLGRYLRWNTWDVLVNPAGILFDVSDRFINPSAYKQTFTTTALFFSFISITYISVRQFIAALNPPRKR